MRTLSAALATVLLASFAVGQVTIPPHSTTYNGYSRGYNFTANTNFFITQLGLPNDAFQAGDTAGFLVQVNGAPVLHSIGNVGPNIATNIQINTGDVVDIIGNWSPATPGNFTAHNSYGSSAPYATTIEGVPHTLNRTGWQWDIGDPAYTSGTYLAPTTGSIGRVFMWTTPPAGLFARFSATPTRGASPLAVQFTDNSFSSDPSGILAWAWDFDNDSVVDSTLQNPSFTYTTCGSFSVALTVFDASHNPDTHTETNFIITDAVVASFTKSLQTGPSTYQFTDTSTPTPTAWAWDFDGDSIIDSTVQNPTWTFPTDCTVSHISMTATLACNTDTATDAIFVAPASLTAQPFSGGNGTGGAAAGNMFDMQVTAPDGINVCGLTVSTYSFTGPFDVEVWVTPGSYANKDANQAAWRLVGTGSGVANGGSSTAPSVQDVVLNSPFYLPAGDYGFIAYYLPVAPTTSVYVAYSNGPLGPFANGDITLYPNPTVNGGLGKYNYFGSGANNPRVFNGTIHYTTCTLTQAPGYGFYNEGCAGTMGISTLSAAAPPRLGQSLAVTVDNLPSNAAIMVLGFSNTTSPAGPLPFDLGSFGATGCFVHVSPDAVRTVIGANNSATWNQSIPNATSLLCAVMWQQALVVDQAANGLGGVTSDAAGFVIGQ